MKVIESGRIERTYSGRCPVCACAFECEEAEVSHSVKVLWFNWSCDPWVECPTCKTRVVVYVLPRGHSSNFSGKVIPPQGGSGTARPILRPDYLSGTHC